MQTIFYPGYLNQPCQAQYGIAIRSDENGPCADIVVIESSGESGQHHTSLLDTAAGRNLLLNKILATDLRGVELNRTRFFVISDPELPFDLLGHEFPMVLDFEDYLRKGNPVEVREVLPTSIKGWLRYFLGFYVKTASALKRDVVVLGVAKRLEVWDRERYAAHRQSSGEQGARLLNGLKAPADLV